MAQVRVIKEFLPKPLSAEEVEAQVKAIIEQTGASSMKDMGKVMGLATKQMAGKADGKDFKHREKGSSTHKPS